MATGFGMAIAFADGASNAYVDVVEPTDCQAPVVSLQYEKKTHLQADHELYEQTIPELGDWSWEQNYSDEEYERHLTNRGESMNVQITFASGATVVFLQEVTSVSTKDDPGEKKIAGTGKVMSMPAFTPSA